MQGLKQHTYDEEARQDKYHPKTKKIEKQTDKQVSVEARENRRNTTDVPINVMLPACGNNIVLLEEKVLSVGALKKMLSEKIQT